MNFVLVQLFDPAFDLFYNITEVIETKPFFINLDKVNTVSHYDPAIHAPKRISKSGEETLDIPENAMGTVYLNSDRSTYHLDLDSSKRVLSLIYKGV